MYVHVHIYSNTTTNVKHFIKAKEGNMKVSLPPPPPPPWLFWYLLWVITIWVPGKAIIRFKIFHIVLVCCTHIPTIYNSVERKLQGEYPVLSQSFRPRLMIFIVKSSSPKYHSACSSCVHTNWWVILNLKLTKSHGSLPHMISYMYYTQKILAEKLSP